MKRIISSFYIWHWGNFVTHICFQLLFNPIAGIQNAVFLYRENPVMLQLLAILKVENEMLIANGLVRSVVALQGSCVEIIGNSMGVVIWYKTIPVFTTCRSKPLQATVSSPMASWPHQWPFSGCQYLFQATSPSVSKCDLLVSSSSLLWYHVPQAQWV